jgi:hypothetical protein
MNNNCHRHGFPAKLPLPCAAVAAAAALVVHAAVAVAAAPSTAATYESLEHSFLTIVRHDTPTIFSGRAWDGRQVHYPETIVDPANGAQLVQFYGGGSYLNNDYAIGRATASVADPYTWTEYAGNPLVGWGTAVHGQAPTVGPNYVFYSVSDGKYWMYYTDYSNWSMYLATSPDGLSWTEYGQVLAPSGDESTSEVAGVIRDDDTHWYMYYSYRTPPPLQQTLPGIRCATSADGKHWTKLPGDVIHVGPPGSYDSTHIEGAQAFKIGATYVIMYSCFDGARYMSALASSASPTGGFLKSAWNPIFQPSEVSGHWDHEQESTAVITGIAGRDYLYYQGTNTPGDYNAAIWHMGVAALGAPPSDAPVVIGNAGFEAPATGSYTYGPFTNGWTFQGTSGVQKNGSAFSGALLAPEGAQSAFLQMTGSIGEAIVFPAPGNYLLGFGAAQRNGTDHQSFDVTVDGARMCSFTPLSSGSFYRYACALPISSGGSHTLSMAGTNPAGGDNTALIDAVKIFDAGSTKWFDDSLPAGATMGADGGDSWTWTASAPAPLAGTRAHTSRLLAGEHQHFFQDATGTLAVGTGDRLYAYAWLDPANMPSEVMLQWRTAGDWEHRAYWGASRIAWGADGGASRRYMGPLPAGGQWVRLEVPAAAVGLAGTTLNGMAFTLYDGRATFDEAGKRRNEVVWVDDALPFGGAPAANWGDSWSWVTASPAPWSGAQAHQSAVVSGAHQHFFQDATATVAVQPGDALFTYVYLDPANMPSELMLQWRTGSDWEHRAYWGTNSLSWGTDASNARRHIAALPAGGAWVRLEVPARSVGLEGATLNGMGYALYGGRASFDRSGSRFGDVVWFDDAPPAGAGTSADGGDSWSWVTAGPSPLAGAQAHQSALVSGEHQHFFQDATTTLAVAYGDVLYVYAYLDPANMPSELMLEWRTGSDWEHRAYWGTNSIAWGADGTNARRYMGALPASGGWVRLEVPAYAVGLEATTLNGMGFALYGGRATFDVAGKSR